MTGWTVVDQGAISAPSQWGVANSNLVQTSQIYTSSDPLQPGTFAWTGDGSWTDYYVKARVRSESDGAIGVMFRYQDANNYYRFSMSKNSSYRRLVKVTGGTAAVLSAQAAGYVTGNKYEVEVRANGSTLEAYIDGDKILTAADTTFSSGGIALYCSRNAGSYFTNVIAAEIDNDTDNDTIPDVLDNDDDGDGYQDYLESLMGADPLSASSTPGSIYINFGPDLSQTPLLYGQNGITGYHQGRGSGWRTQLTSVLLASGLIQPVFVTHAPGDFDRIFIVELRVGTTGMIRIFNLATGQLLPTPFLSISPVATGGEQGLLGLAFHPNYAVNGLFYVNYTDAAGTTVIERYQVSGDPNVANPSSAQTVLTVAQPYSNHNGGWLCFGPDGYLYVALGDGGSGGDPQNRAQNLNELLGKMLRVDVDGDDFPSDFQRNYAIPPTNPFVGTSGLDEIWAYGFRNPWRSSFDRATGDLWIADVGQSDWEEISFQPAASAGGENYGWRCYEGNNPYNTSGCQPSSSMVFPIYEYSHGPGHCSVTGGYVYRGSAIPSLNGAYFFADFCSGHIWSLRYDGASITEFIDRTTEINPGAGLTINSITSFGEDAAGELYVCDLGGEVFKIVPAGL